MTVQKKKKFGSHIKKAITQDFRESFGQLDQKIVVKHIFQLTVTIKAVLSQ